MTPCTRAKYRQWVYENEGKEGVRNDATLISEPPCVIWFKGILGRVARAVGITTRRFEFTEIEGALRAREIAIAKHFYALGKAGACDMWPTLPNQWFEDHMPKVKP